MTIKEYFDFPIWALLYIWKGIENAKGEFSIEPWYALVKIAPSVYESVQVY